MDFIVTRTKNSFSLYIGDLNIQDPIIIHIIWTKQICFPSIFFLSKRKTVRVPFASKILVMAQNYCTDSRVENALNLYNLYNKALRSYIYGQTAGPNGLKYFEEILESPGG